MATPDIRVRLSPEGVKEVIEALRRVQDAGKQANQKAAKEVGLVSQAVRELKSLLPTLGIAAAVTAMVALGRRSLQTADEIGKLQQRVGGTAQDLSALTFAFRTNGSSQDEAQDTLLALSKRLDELRSGVPETVESFARLGLVAEDFANLDTPQAFELLARAIARLPAGYDKAAIAGKVLNKSAAEIIPVLNAVGEQGIAAFADRARQLGVLVEDELSKASARVRDAFDNIKLQAEGVATTFLSGFAPQIAGAMEDFARAVEGDGEGALQRFGTFAGIVVRNTIAMFLSLGKAIGANVAALEVLQSRGREAALAALRGNFAEARQIMEAGRAEIRAISEQLEKDQAALYDAVATPPDPNKADARGGNRGRTTAPTNDTERRNAQARLAFLRAQLEAEAAIQREKFQAQADADKAAYEQGLISLTEYFRRRRELTRAQAETELATLRAQRQLVASSELAEIRKLEAQRAAARAKGPAGNAGGASPASLTADLEARKLAIRQQLAELDGKIAVRQIALQRELAALDAEALQAERQLQSERIAADNKLDELEGRRHAVFTRNLADEIRQTREFGVKAGETADQIEQRVQRLSRARSAIFNFEEAQRSASQALDAFERDAEQIRRDTEAGILTQLGGEQALIELEGKRLQVLKQLAAALLEAAKATGDPEKIAQAQAYADSVANIEASYRKATDAAAAMGQALEEGAQRGFQDLFANLDKIHSLRDAMQQLGDTVLSTLRQTAAELLSKKIVQGIEGIFNSLQCGGGGGGGAGFLQGIGKLFGFADGGYTGDGGTYQPAGVVHAGEFVVRKSVVARAGVRPMLEALNGGALRSASLLPGYAAGGFVAALEPLLAARGAGSPIQINQTIQAPDERVGERSARQAAFLASREIRRAEGRDA